MPVFPGQGQPFFKSFNAKNIKLTKLKSEDVNKERLSIKYKVSFDKSE